MNSVVKLLLYKRYEDRISKLKILSLTWFVIFFYVFSVLNYSVLAGLFGGLMMTVPFYSAGLILDILFSYDENTQVKTKNDEVKTESVKTIDDDYSAETYREKDNVGTRQDSLEKANAYWLGTRLQMKEKPPFSLYVFKSASDAENALLELPFIHKADDTGNLICDKVMEFGYYKVEGDEYEAIISGFDFTLDEFNQVEESFKKHNGVLKNNLEPSSDVKQTKSVEGNKDNVKFRETITKNQYTYECYDAKSKADAMEFLKDRKVSEGLYYVCVYTPEGDFGRDINGIYEM